MSGMRCKARQRRRRQRDIPRGVRYFAAPMIDGCRRKHSRAKVLFWNIDAFQLKITRNAQKRSHEVNF